METFLHIDYRGGLQRQKSPMEIPITTATLISSTVFGAISAYFAHRRGRNPYKWFFIGLLFGMLGCFALFFAPKAKSKQEEPDSKPPLEPLIITGPLQKPWYYLDAAHQQIGPMSRNALMDALKEQKISLSTYVWNEEMTAWQPLKDLTLPK